MRFLIILIAVLSLASGPPGAVAAVADSEPSKEGLAYDVQFEGLADNTEVQDLVLAVSALQKQRDDPPVSRPALRRRVDRDLERFGRVARSVGYYDAVFEATIGDSEAADGGLLVVVTAALGPVYGYGDITIVADGLDGSSDAITVARRDVALMPGAPARAEHVVNAEAAIAQAMQEKGFPLARMVDRTVTVDRDTKTMAVRYRLDPGPPGRFGAVTVSGNDTVSERYVLRRLPWVYGDPADVRRLEQGRLALVGTGLFARVAVAFDDAVGPDGLIPITVTLVERDRRSIGAGVSASTSEGLGSSAFWTHRNVLGGAEQLRLEGRFGEVETGVGSTFSIPDVFLNDQDLIFRAGFFERSTDGFDSTSLTFDGHFERRVTPVLSFDYGLSFERSRIEDDGDEDMFTLVGIPIGARIDTADDLLNPTRGSRTRLVFTPYLETLGSTQSFYATTARHSRYWSLDTEGTFILAGRASIASIVGASTENLPADKRLYSGGSGSVRGYELQSVGPLDTVDEPLGGRSLLEGSLELRWRAFGDFGLVPFFDVGQVYDQEFPELDQELQWAAGIGLRYFTAIGPVRADIAFPLNPRDSDDAFQVYFSIGQAF